MMSEEEVKEMSEEEMVFEIVKRLAMVILNLTVTELHEQANLALRSIRQIRRLSKLNEVATMSH